MRNCASASKPCWWDDDWPWLVVATRVVRLLTWTCLAWAGSAGFQTCWVADFQVGCVCPCRASLETRDTADLEVRATLSTDG